MQQAAQSQGVPATAELFRGSLARIPRQPAWSDECGGSPVFSPLASQLVV